MCKCKADFTAAASVDHLGMIGDDFESHLGMIGDGFESHLGMSGDDFESHLSSQKERY